MFFIALTFIVVFELLGVCALLITLGPAVRSLAEIEWRVWWSNLLRSLIPSRQEEEWPDAIEVDW